jgi:hypothetical protein
MSGYSAEVTELGDRFRDVELLTKPPSITMLLSAVQRALSRPR